MYLPCVLECYGTTRREERAYLYEVGEIVVATGAAAGTVAGCRFNRGGGRAGRLTGLSSSCACSLTPLAGR